MNLYDNIFDVLWEHLTNFEMNILSMEYPKQLLNNVTNDFCCKKYFLKDVKWF